MEWGDGVIVKAYTPQTFIYYFSKIKTNYNTKKQKKQMHRLNMFTTRTEHTLRKLIFYF